VVNVTLEDLELGEQKNCSRCPVVRAIRRAIDASPLGILEFNVSVNYQTWSIAFWICGEGSNRIIDWRGNTPTIIAGFMEAFDKNQPVQPFAMQLRNRGTVWEFVEV
jgi:hypothetical protein